MKVGPGHIFKNSIRGIGIKTYSKDIIVNQHIPTPTPIIEEPIQEFKQEENELQHTQVEQATLPSGSEYTRDSSPGDKQDSSRKSRV